MTEKEIKNLLFNIFDVDFKHNSIKSNRYFYIKNANDFIEIYFFTSLFNGNWFKIYTQENNYNNVIYKLNNQKHNGFIEYSSKQHSLNTISFCLYKNLKNIDI